MNDEAKLYEAKLNSKLHCGSGEEYNFGFTLQICLISKQQEPLFANPPCSSSPKRLIVY